MHFVGGMVILTRKYWVFGQTGEDFVGQSKVVQQLTVAAELGGNGMIKISENQNNQHTLADAMELALRNEEFFQQRTTNKIADI